MSCTYWLRSGSAGARRANHMRRPATPPTTRVAIATSAGETTRARPACERRCRVALPRQATEIDDHLPHRLKALCGILFEGLLHEHAKRGWHIRRQRPGGRSPASASYSTRPKEKMSLRASSGFPEACSGDIYGSVPRMSRGWLRNGLCAGDRFRRRVVKDFGETEVRQLRVAAAREQNVLGLDVAVENAGFMRQRETVRHSRQQFDVCPNQGAALQPILERATSTSSVTRY